MNKLQQYIQEKLKINSKSKVSKYNYKPIDEYELRRILEDKLKDDQNANLNDIDLSEVDNLGELEKFEHGNYETYGLFENLDPYNIDISEWDVSHIKDMQSMFKDCENLNCDLSNWDVSNVKWMMNMFEGCKKFNKDISNWDVRNVKNMANMFKKCPLEKNPPKWYHE